MSHGSIPFVASTDIAIVVRNLRNVSPAEAEWLELLLTVLGDSAELWNWEPRAFTPVYDNDNAMAVDGSGPAPPSTPQPARSGAASFNPGPVAATYLTQHASSQSLPSEPRVGVGGRHKAGHDAVR